MDFEISNTAYITSDGILIMGVIWISYFKVNCLSVIFG